MGDNTSKRSGFGIGEAGSVPASTPLEDWEAEERAALGMRPTQMYRCEQCGCRTAHPMSSSRGSVCFDCYTEMDD